MGEHVANISSFWTEAVANGPIVIHGIHRTKRATTEDEWQTQPQTEWNNARQVATSLSLPYSASDRSGVRDELDAAGQGAFDNLLEDDDERDCWILHLAMSPVW